jgi:predicted oxidoreductase
MTLKTPLQPNNPKSLQLSRLVYGAWRLADDADTSVANVHNKVDACLAQGISSFDHADIYGDYRCEAVFGQLLRESPSLRDEMELISKCGIMLISDQYPERRVKYYDTSAAHINHSIENSLRNLHTDHLDLLLIHRPDPFMNAEETGRALDAIIDSGKTKAVGVSNFMPDDFALLQAHMSHPLVTNQIEMSLLNHNAFHDGSLAYLQQNGLRPMAWSPLAGGQLFSDQSTADGSAVSRVKPLLNKLAEQHDCGIDHIALGWLLNHPATILPIVGTNNIDRIAKVSKALDINIDRETWFEIWTAAAGEEVA